MENVIAKMKLVDTVITRRMPFTGEGMDNLRRLREHFREIYRKRTGNDIEIPFPSVVDIVLREYCNANNVATLPDVSNSSPE